MSKREPAFCLNCRYQFNVHAPAVCPECGASTHLQHLSESPALPGTPVQTKDGRTVGRMPNVHEGEPSPVYKQCHAVKDVLAKHPLPWMVGDKSIGYVQSRICDATCRPVVDPVANEDGMDDDVRQLIVDAVNAYGKSQ